MGCNNYINLLSPYIDNTLSNREKFELEAHLNTCASCKEELNIQKNIRQLLLKQNNLTIPNELHDKIMQSIINEDRSKKKQLFTYNRKYMQALTTMAACFLFIISFLVFQNSPYNTKSFAAKEDGNVAAQSAHENAIMEKHEDESIDNSALIDKNRSIDSNLAMKQEDSIDNSDQKSENRSLDNNIMINQEDINNKSLKDGVSSLDNSQDIDTDIMPSSEVNLTNSTDETTPKTDVQSIEDSKESISEEYWEVLYSDRMAAYDQIKELLIKRNIEYDVDENESITISLYTQNKDNLMNQLKSLSAVRDISRTSGLDNKIIIVIK